jgi:ATP-dependent Clp protease ATP-binding subunit ClpC
MATKLTRHTKRRNTSRRATGIDRPDMFERFTERAKRVLFFARYESSTLGDRVIDTEHILLGLLREGKGLLSPVFARANISLPNVRARLEAARGQRPQIPTSVEIPFTEPARHAIEYAVEESDGLHHRQAGTEHLLLGLLRVDGSTAASILAEHGLQLDTTRNEIVRLLNDTKDARRASDLPPIEDMQRLIWQYGVLTDNAEAREIIERISRDLEALNRLLG